MSEYYHRGAERRQIMSEYSPDPKKCWIMTYLGTKFYPFDPKVEDVCINDIAHSLSLTCRYSGHCSQFYSVAQHCLEVAKILPDELKLQGLLHDSAECYIGDLASPVKYGMPYYREVEKSILSTVHKAFGVSVNGNSDAILKADLTLLATEARDLMKSTEGWLLPEPPLDSRIEVMSSKEAELMFISMFYIYGGKQKGD
jgi:hypothetical protein